MVTQHEEAIETPRCNIWWHLLICGGLVLSGMLGLGAGLLSVNSEAGATGTKVEVHDAALLRIGEDMKEMKGDLKELLRRNSLKSGVGDRG